jgi:hypothetical protein
MLSHLWSDYVELYGSGVDLSVTALSNLIKFIQTFTSILSFHLDQYNHERHPLPSLRFLLRKFR